ncbi:hypothetical protein GUJ93_ZPchr0012g21320 [Zizania palustris]|uniref:Uncharacterized protein n=1 Tax=Zizania palustris TaxID=103762 RepID=A0A8J5WV30_ZIZPA|nr:hypothetical protein GUJ93_ZPchr0012g21320 [Zizania palustris]
MFTPAWPRGEGINSYQAAVLSLLASATSVAMRCKTTNSRKAVALCCATLIKKTKKNSSIDFLETVRWESLLGDALRGVVEKKKVLG